MPISAVVDYLNLIAIFDSIAKVYLILSSIEKECTTGAS